MRQRALDAAGLTPRTAESMNYPALDRAINAAYPPGSTFKPVTAIAAMQEHILQPYEPLSCTGQYEKNGQIFKNWDPFVNEAMTLTTALARSCDTYFYQVGYRFYGMPARLGPRLQAWASRFGFGQKTGLDLGSERSGLLPTPAWRKETYTKKTDPGHWQIDSLWKPGDSIQLAIGQKDLLVTPLQMARFYAAIANGGKLVTPHLLLDVEQPSANRRTGRVLPITRPPAPEQTGVDAQALEVVRRGSSKRRMPHWALRRRSSAASRFRSPARPARRRSRSTRATATCTPSTSRGGAATARPTRPTSSSAR